MSAFHRVASKLSELGYLVSVTVKDQKGMAQCPAHDDRVQSLSLSVGKNNDRAVLHCFAGCETEAIVEKLGMTMADLYDDKATAQTGTAVEIYYDYKDEDGNLLNQVVRTVPKGFRQRRPDGLGGWIWNLEGVRRVMYKLPEIQGKRAVLLVEGEKDADNLWRFKLPATTTLGGSSAWKPEFAQQLADANVKRLGILPDNDEPGRKYAERAAKDCHEAGIDVSIITLPGLGAKEDVSDFLERAAHPRGDLLRAIQAGIELPTVPLGGAATLAEALEGVPLWQPGQPAKKHRGWRRGRDLDDTPITYLVDTMIPKGMLGSISGRDKRGKSLLALEIAKAVLTGEPLFGSFNVNGGKPGVVYVLLMDDPEFLVRDRLNKLGILDHPNLYIKTRNDVDEVIKQERTVEFLQDLAEEIKADKPDLVIIDALYVLIPGGGGRGGDPQNSAGVMKPIMQALDEVCNVSPGTTVGVVIHTNKSGNDLSGSQTIRNMLKWILILDIPRKYEKDIHGGRITPDRVLQLDGLKTGAAAQWGLRIVGRPDGTVGWEQVDVEELEASDKKKDKMERAMKCIEWLEFLLENGPMERLAIEQAGWGDGFKFTKREINKAAESLGVEKTHSGPKDPWIWRLKA